MRVALDVSAMPPRLAGAGRYVAEISQRLPDFLALEIVARRDDGERWSALSSATVHPIVANHRAMRLVDEAIHLGWSAPARAVDVWHAPHYTMPRIGAVPTAVTIHDLTFFTNPEWHESTKVSFFQRAIRYATRHADALICVSNFTAAQLADLLPTNVPIVVAPHGVDGTLFNPHDGDDDERFDRAGLPINQPFVLFVGTFEPRKGIDVLLESFRHLGSENPSLELWIAGQRGWGTAAEEALVREHPFTSRIRRLGFVADSLLPALYRRATVVAYPSRGEGFGLPVLEALACGAAVVTSAETVMAEVAGGAAWLAPVGDPIAVATAMSQILALASPDRSAVAARAVEQAQRFTWEQSITEHRRAYEIAKAR